MSTPEPGHRAPILIVDDSPADLDVLEGILGRDDYELVRASSGREALGQMLRQEFAVILLDVFLPEMDGYETARLIKQRERSKHTPIIFISGSGSSLQHFIRAYSAGAVDYLGKPLDPDQLRTKVEVFVQLYRQRHQIARQAAELREAELREQRLRLERAEVALRQSEAIHQLTFEHAPVAIGHITGKGRWTRANPRLEQLLEALPDDAARTGLADLVCPEDRGLIEDALQRLRKGDIETYAGEHRLLTGKDVWARITISAPHQPLEAMVDRRIVVIDDISARRRMERERMALMDELRSAVRARDDFLAIAAHELKTPITPLRLQTQMLLREGKRHGDPTLMRRLAAIERSVIRLEGLIDRLLDISRFSVGRPVLEPEEVDLAKLVEEVVERERDAASALGSDVRLRAEPVTGRWDRMRLEQVVTNLLTNAIKYGDGKPVDVFVGVAGESGATLVVEDHGPGIPEEARERIFQRFERLTSVRHHGGFGLGLWIVRQIVEAHGGRIQVSSKPGQGSRFEVSLPRTTSAPELEEGEA